MRGLPLVLGLPSGPVSLGLELLAGALGLAVGYVAFLGYRHNRSLPMLFVAAGFLVTFWTPALLVGALAVLRTGATLSPGLETAVPRAVRTAGRICEVVGLLLILYGLAMPIRE